MTPGGVVAAQAGALQPSRWLAGAWRLFVSCLALWLAVATAGGAQEVANAMPVGSDAAARAVFLHSFLGYVEWPPAAFKLADDPFVIGVMNADPVAAELLLSTTGRSVGNRPVLIKPLQEGGKPDGVHLLYIGPTPSARLSAILAQVSERWTVTVTDGENGLEMGSAINFRKVGQRLRFEVSMPVVERSDYRLSSRMLGVALIRKGGG